MVLGCMKSHNEMLLIDLLVTHLVTDQNPYLKQMSIRLLKRDVIN